MHKIRPETQKSSPGRRMWGTGRSPRIGSNDPAPSGADSPSPALTSWIHWSSFSLFFPSRPHRATHSPRSSSHSCFSLFLWLIPFSLAKRSHLVSGLGLGRGFSRGSNVVGVGRRAVGPDGVEWVGSEKSEERREWVEVSVRARRWGSSEVLKRVG